MALDGIFLNSILEELKLKLLNSKVDKISQPEKDELIMYLRGDRSTYRLLFSASSLYPKVHLTESSKPNPIKAPMFCMVLRKYLSNARLVDIYQKQTDRIAVFVFESADELGFYSKYSLIIEIMGRHSNLTLVRERDNMVIDSIKHITPDINSFRSLYPGIEYIYPPKSNKLNPFDFTKEALSSLVEENNINLEQKLFSELFTGVGLQFSKELFKRLQLAEHNVDMHSGNFYNFIKSNFQSIENKNFDFASYVENDTIKDFYCTSLDSLYDAGKTIYSSPSKLLEDFYLEKDKSDRLNARSSDLQKIIGINLDRCYKKVDILKASLEESLGKDNFKISGELLTANIYNIRKGMKEIKVLNYYSENGEEITIKLDENKTPSENIQYYYKKYNKLKKTEEMASAQLESTQQEIEYLLSVLTNIKNCESYDEIEDIRRELQQTGYVRIRKTDSKKIKNTRPLHFLSSDEIDIFVGKNNLQNDFLTLKFAEKHDLWMHTKNIPGSHVIIRTSSNVPERTLLEAATLAAFYSKAKDSSKVPVDYTQVKNVRKPSGAKPGMVIYYTNKTIYVDPYDIKLTKVDK